MTTAELEPTLPDLVRLVWQARVNVIIGIVAGCLAALLFVMFAVPHYRITMLVAPVDRSVRADIKSFMPDNPGFALQYVAGSMASPDTTDFSRFEHTMRGRSVAEILMNDPALIDALRRDRKFSFANAPRLGNADDLALLLNKTITISPVGNTTLRRVTYDHPDPAFGISLLRRIADQADQMIRQDVAKRAKERTDYLKNVLSSTTHPDHRRALTALLMEQEHIMMILAMDEPFAATIAEPPAASPLPSWPRKSMVFIGFAFAGALLGFAFRGSGQTA